MPRYVTSLKLRKRPIAIFDNGLFDHPENEVDKNSFIFEVDIEYPPGLHERDDEYLLAPEVMTIEPEITGKKQHNLRAVYFGEACSYSRKLICSLFPNKHYVVLYQLLRVYYDRAMKPIKLHLSIRFKSSPYVASYIANNTAKRQQYKHDDVNKLSISL